MAGVLATIVGAVMLSAGLFGVGGYVYRALEVLDEPDRSWLFWGLAILFGGLWLAAMGCALLLWGWTRLVRSFRTERALVDRSDVEVGPDPDDPH